MVFLTILAFIVVFSALVLVHEWGHFIVARKAGIKVEEFGAGFPPRAKTLFKDKHGTAFTLNWIPFGGFVRLHGEDAHDPEARRDPQAFCHKPLFWRAAVVVAGVLMNFLLAWLLITIGFGLGMSPFITGSEDLARAVQSGLAQTRHTLYLNELLPDSPLAEAGVKAGVLITALDGVPAPQAEQLASRLSPHKSVRLSLEENGEAREVTVNTNGQGKLGISISDQTLVTQIGKVRTPWVTAPWYAFKETGRLSVLTVKLLGQVVVGFVSKLAVPDGVSGPVGIARMTGQYLKAGAMPMLQFVALLSISLGVLNIMPFPALDGGRLLFIGVEALVRRRLSAKWEGLVHAVGYAFLLALIFAVTWKDIAQIVAGR